MTALLNIQDFRMQLPIKGQQREILRGVDLQVHPGEAVGIVGESGSGKSMLVRAAVGLLPQGAKASGLMSFNNEEVFAMNSRRLSHYRADEVAMVFQDPRGHMNPLRTIGDFLTEAMILKGRTRTEAFKTAGDLLEEVRIADPGRVLASYPHQVSGGMLQRVMFASAISANPRLLLADEPTTALDVTTQAEVMAIINELRLEREMAMVMVTHDLDLAAATCDRTAVMYAGRVVEERVSSTLHQKAAHPYTIGLMLARPRIDHRADRLAAMPGQPLPPYLAGAGCSFAPRCSWSTEKCTVEDPTLRPLAGGKAACHYAEQVQSESPAKTQTGATS